TITLNAQAGSVSASPASFTLTVTDAPLVFSSGTTASVTEGDPGTTQIYTAAAIDPGGEAVAYNLTDGGDGAFQVHGTSGPVTVKDATRLPDVGGTISFTVQAAEADDGDDAGTQTVVVTVNEAPLVFSSGTTASVTEGDPGATPFYTAAATDPGREQVD